MIARVIVDLKHHQVNRLFDYFIPAEMESFLQRGMRVIVPFNEMKRLGFVVEIVEESNQASKEIEDVLDVEPIIDDELFEHIDLLMKTSNITLSHAFETVLPSEIFIQYEKQVICLDESRIDQSLKSKFNKNGVWVLKKSDIQYQYQIKKLKEAKIVETRTALKTKAKAKVIKTYHFNVNHRYHKINNNLELISFFNNHDEVNKADLNAYGFSDAQIKTLIKHEVLQVIEKEVIRNPYSHIIENKKDIKLTDEQNKVLNQILSKQDQYLLKGVTGSGKTEIYIKLIESYVMKGAKVLLLVPEITLILQMLKRVSPYVEKIAIYHSGLSHGERYDQYERIRNQNVHLIIGTRSAIFSPIQNLGLIIVDECHDQAYIQEDSTYYDAITHAIKKASYHQATLLLGSATPSVEHMFYALNKQFRLVELKSRPLNLPMPKIEYVDMKQELTKGNTSIFSEVLMQKIESRLKNKEQVLLLFNRKGYAPYIMCRQCGHVPTCPTCQIALTYFKSDGLLKCSYCHYKEAKQLSCQSCQSTAIKEVGVGIEYVEEVLKKTFSNAKIARMDKQTIKTKNGHETLIKDFDEQAYDILLGTQMIAKGLDFKNVTLSAIIMADLSLNIPSYTASEQAYILFAQMTGRSGRFYPGEALVQAYHLDHFAIKSLSKNYDAFYKEAIHIRKLANYAPFKQMAKITFEGEQYLKTYQEAFKIKKYLESQDHEVLGPYEQTLNRKVDIYKFEMVVKYIKLDKSELFIKITELMQKKWFVRFFPMSREI
jgi:primosomal protein N' (replication factor Y) (superfamily II helicase)